MGNLYIVDFNRERPLSAIEIPKLKTTYLNYSEATDLLFIGYRNGSW